MFKYIIALLDWSKVLVFLYGKDKKVLFKEDEIWWCSIGMNVGVEIYGKGNKFARPVLIFKKFDGDSFLGLPLTSKTKEGTWHMPIHSGGGDGTVLLAQARVFDARRLIKKIGMINAGDLNNIQASFRQLYTPVLSQENIDPAEVAGDDNLSPATEPENGGLPQT
jgi:mRNA interferase MazF